MTAQVVRIADLDPDTADLVRLIARAKRAKERRHQHPEEAVAEGSGSLSADRRSAGSQP